MSDQNVSSAARHEEQWFSRFPAATQVYIAAGLLLPTFLIFGAWNTVVADIGWIGFALLYGVYLCAVLVLVARSKSRRNWALVVATITLAVDLGQTWYGTSADTPQMTLAAFILFRWWLTVGYVAAWGIARRLDTKWIVGLPLAALATIVVIAPVEMNVDYENVFQRWAVWIGGFIIGSLICWGLDAYARGALGQQTT